MRSDVYDVVVVGARCAGAATAMLLARAGARVLLIDRDARGSDALSTHALMRTGVALLQKWNVLPAVIAAGTPAVRQSTFFYGEEGVSVAIKPALSVDALYAPRRWLLDRLLGDAAAGAGADVAYGVAFEALERDNSGRVTGVVLRDGSEQPRSVRCDLVVGADGRRSTVAKAVGARFQRMSAHRAAGIFAYVAGIEGAGYRWSYAPGAAAGAIPTNDGLHCVFAMLPPERMRDLLQGRGCDALVEGVGMSDPELANALIDGQQVDGLRRFLGANGYLREAQGPGWALVGDAGYFKDPITAHGITDALRDASLLVKAFAQTGEPGLVDYQHTRDALSSELFDATDAIASFGWDLETLKAHHARLKTAMAAEQAHMFPAAQPAQRAA